jgi:hypothetical protein
MDEGYDPEDFEDDEMDPDDYYNDEYWFFDHFVV